MTQQFRGGTYNSLFSFLGGSSIVHDSLLYKHEIMCQWKERQKQNDIRKSSSLGIFPFTWSGRGVELRGKIMRVDMNCARPSTRGKVTSDQ